MPPPNSSFYRLHLNENLFLPRELVSDAVSRALEFMDPRFYHQPHGEELAERLAEFYGVDPGEIVVGAGADHLIYLTAHFGRDGGAAIVEPTFEEYARALRLSGAPYVKVLLTEEFQLDVEKLGRVDAGLLYLASPNNPTANQFERDPVLEAVKGFKVVVLDEAYAEYAHYTMIGEATSYDNLIVVRTFSKAWGLAGLRVGYAVTNRGLASKLRERGPVYACSSLSLKAAEFMLEHWSEVKKAVDELKSVREWMRERLVSLSVKVYPSDTNFLLIRLPVDSAWAREALLRRGFAVKDVGHAPLCRNCIRVTVPPKPIAEAFVEALRTTLEEGLEKQKVK